MKFRENCGLDLLKETSGRGFDDDQDLTKKVENDTSLTRRGGRLSFLHNLLCPGQRMSKDFPETSIKSYKVDSLAKKITICFDFP